MIELSETLANKEEQNKDEVILFGKNPEDEPEEKLYLSEPRLYNFMQNKVFYSISKLSICLFFMFLVHLFFFEIQNPKIDSNNKNNLISNSSQKEDIKINSNSTDSLIYTNKSQNIINNSSL